MSMLEIKEREKKKKAERDPDGLWPRRGACSQNGEEVR